MNIGNIIVTVINSLGALSTKYIHIMLDALEDFVTNSKTPVDNSIFYKVITAVQSWKPKKKVG